MVSAAEKPHEPACALAGFIGWPDSCGSIHSVSFYRNGQRRRGKHWLYFAQVHSVHMRFRSPSVRISEKVGLAYY